MNLKHTVCSALFALLVGGASAHAGVQMSSPATTCIPSADSVSRISSGLSYVSFAPGQTGTITLYCVVDPHSWGATAAAASMSFTFKDGDGNGSGYVKATLHWIYEGSGTDGASTLFTYTSSGSSAIRKQDVVVGPTTFSPYLNYYYLKLELHRSSTEDERIYGVALNY